VRRQRFRPHEPPSTRRLAEIPGSNLLTANRNNDTYVRGIQVCVNNSVVPRIKGVRIYGTKLNRNTGALVDTNGYKGFSRPNCSTWKTVKYCGPNKVATGLEIHHINNWFAGLALVCHAVLPK